MKLWPDGFLAVGCLILCVPPIYVMVADIHEINVKARESESLKSQNQVLTARLAEKQKELSWEQHRRSKDEQAITTLEKLIKDADLSVPDPRSPDFPEYCRFLNVDPKSTADCYYSLRRRL